MFGCAQMVLAFVLLTSASQVGAQLGPQWFGTWKSEDGRSVKKISASGIDGMRWTSKSEDDLGDLYEVYGYSKKPSSPADISKRYERALRDYRKDPTDFNVSDPDESRRAINAIAPRIYKVMWSYEGGDCGFEEHVVDGDKMLVVSECKYGFGVRLFKRVR